MTLSDLPLREVPVVAPSESLEEAIALLSAEPLKLVVLVGDGMYQGVLSEAALEPGLIPAGADLSTLAVGPYTHPSRVVARPEWSVEETLALVKRKQIDVFPLVAGAIYKGTLTRADLETRVHK